MICPDCRVHGVFVDSKLKDNNFVICSTFYCKNCEKIFHYDQKPTVNTDALHEHHTPIIKQQEQEKGERAEKEKIENQAPETEPIINKPYIDKGYSSRIDHPSLETLCFKIKLDVSATQRKVIHIAKEKQQLSPPPLQSMEQTKTTTFSKLKIKPSKFKKHKKKFRSKDRVPFWKRKGKGFHSFEQ